MNIKEYRYQVARSGLSNRQIAKLLGIGIETYYKKLNGKSAWRLVDIQRIREILELSDDKLRQIFFEKEVS